MNEIYKGMDNAAEQINENFEMLGFEFDSNNNGNYLRLPGGVQICWGNTIVLSSSSSSSYKEGEIIFPAEFKDTNYSVSLSPNSGGVANFGGVIHLDPTTSGCTVHVNRSSTANTDLRYIAIGTY